MNQYEHVMRPGQIGQLAIKNRISMSPMERNLGDRVGNPTQAYVDYMVERAKGDVGLMNMEATYIDPRGRGNLFQLGLWDDSNIEWHKRLNDAVHPFGVKTSAQLNHGGRNVNTARTGFQPVAPSPIPNDIVGGWIPHELTKEEIAIVVGRFADGARRAVKAGYDIITIHGAHGYLITSFLSPKYNQRTDEYGGSDRNRWRFAVEVYSAIRDTVGPDVPVGIRISASEDVEGGMTIDQSVDFITHLTGLGLDFVDVSAGIYESLETVIQPMDILQGCLLPYARGIKKNVRIPVIAAGRVNDLDIAERAVSSGDADFVQMSRALHADPKIYVKTINGNKDDVVGCIACNKCCSELFINQRTVCTVNPVAGRERHIRLTPAARPRTIMVVGGGLAGMEAATIAARRNHDVTLYEKNDTCGGITTIMSASRHRVNWGRAAQDRIRMLGNCGAKVITGKKVELADIEAEKPDVVVLATGTRPFMPAYIPGLGEEIVTNYDDLIRGRVDIGVNVVVVGGGHSIGTTTAEFLTEHGANVTLIETTDTLAADEEYMTRKMFLDRLERSNQIMVHKKTTVEIIGPDSVTIQSGGNVEILADIDQVVLAIDREMECSLYEELSGDRAEELGIELHLIGDAAWPRHPYDAINEGMMLGLSI